MSGGYFNYVQWHITEIADEIANIIKNNNSQEKDEWGDTRGRSYPDDIIESFKTGVEHLRIAAVYAQRIDWLLSGDDGEESFRERLKEDLAEVEK
jgi:hypothetical protein